jgi:hypothetical protein
MIESAWSDTHAMCGTDDDLTDPASCLKVKLYRPAHCAADEPTQHPVRFHVFIRTGKHQEVAPRKPARLPSYCKYITFHLGIALLVECIAKLFNTVAGKRLCELTNRRCFQNAIARRGALPVLKHLTGEFVVA